MQAESVRVFALFLCPPSAYLVVFLLDIMQKKWREKRKDEYYGGTVLFYLLSSIFLDSGDVERD